MNFIAVVVFAFLLLSFNAVSQESPRVIEQGRQVFNNVPQKIKVNSEELIRIFRYETNDSVLFRLNKDLLLEARIIAKQTKPSGVISVNLVAGNYPGILFNFTLIRQGAKQKIQGRAVHKNIGDALVLVEENGEYFFNKVQRKRILSDHGTPDR